MKVSGCWVLFLLAGLAFMFVGYSSSSTDRVFSGQHDSVIMKAKSRKLIKENEGYYVNVQDYRPIDPVPSSKASIRPGPIQHGSPLIPFIPKAPLPPHHPGQNPSP